ncbi:Conserved hypothetical protein [Shewanella piezotolerans WP3]|uniref:Uncharacterized protein n=1 Tax=Shewanella piezotolerans (strain WP3 / JCM 13877) TaxID=225849 RepID=B8CK10_SHEPW|nr:hypothetical protein [Shewanella piezotolerans]ACJ27713.1 Conserved hypothetical protein [Shewanella piezotolerans WP3]
MFDEFKVQLTTFDWNGVSGLTNILMVILTGLLLYGLKQGSSNIKESSLSRDADILRWAMTEMDLLKPAIRILTDAHKTRSFCNCPGEHIKHYDCSWNKEELAAAQEVSVKLQRIGYMALHNLISRNHFMNIWGPMYLSTWYSLEAWVKHKRLDLDEPLTIENGAYSRIYLEQFAHYCEKNMPEVLVNNERRRFNLPTLSNEKRKKARVTSKVFKSKKEKLNI